jgi:ABC-type sugar transport system substrate-binding protein
VDVTPSRNTRGLVRRGACVTALALPLALAAAACSSSSSSSGTSSGNPAAGSNTSYESPSALAHPTKALCKKKSYTIGYDVFSGSQPFANLVTQGLVDAAKSIGCVKVLKTIDNENGPVAVGNLKTLVNEHIQGFVDFQVLAAYQSPIATELKTAKIPGVAIVGANLPGSPNVGASNYTASVDDGQYLAAQAKSRFAGKVPYLLVGAEPSCGAICLQRYTGAVAGVKKVFPTLPKSHIIEVQTDGTETTAYNNTESALSTVPAGSVVLLTGVNDEVTGGMFKAAQARHITNSLVNSFGGDPYGLSQVCAQPTHYVGAWYLEPTVWGASSLSVILDEINGLKVPSQVGIVGEEVTHTSSVANCK